MFTGLIESCSEVLSLSSRVGGKRLVIRSLFNDVSLGESIAVNGVCLTALLENEGELAFDLSAETLDRTNLSALSVGSCVNLERAMLASTRFGGHYVTGHVDTIASIQAIRPEGDYLCVEVGGFTTQERAYLLTKGSITLNGVSLTINAVEEGVIHLMLVPHTLLKTTLKYAKVGDSLNVEFDYIARLVAHQLGSCVDSTIMSSFLRVHHDAEVKT